MIFRVLLYLSRSTDNPKKPSGFKLIRISLDSGQSQNA